MILFFFLSCQSQPLKRILLCQKINSRHFPLVFSFSFLSCAFSHISSSRFLHSYLFSFRFINFLVLFPSVPLLFIPFLPVPHPLFLSPFLHQHSVLFFSTLLFFFFLLSSFSVSPFLLLLSLSFPSFMSLFHLLSFILCSLILLSSASPFIRLSLLI